MNTNTSVNKRIKQNKPFLEIQSKFEFITEINRRLPDCLKVVVRDNISSSTVHVNSSDKHKDRLQSEFDDAIKEVDLNVCVYEQKKHDFLNYDLSLLLLYQTESTTICLGAVECIMHRNPKNRDELNLYARTNKKFGRHAIYKFLVGMLIFYVGKYTSVIFKSEAVHVASSLVLKRFQQSIFNIEYKTIDPQKMIKKSNQKGVQ